MFILISGPIITTEDATLSPRPPAVSRGLLLAAIITRHQTTPAPHCTALTVMVRVGFFSPL